MFRQQSIIELQESLKRGELSSVQLVTHSLETIAKYDDQLKSFVTLRDRETLLAEAKQADETRSPDSSPLHGIPYALKDAYLTEGVTTTSASKVLEDFMPPYSATVYQRLNKAGAILIGKNNQDAWGHGGSTENTDFGAARNPWDLNKIPGGSSGGSAACLAADMVAFTIGEDTGGSIRNPSSHCNTCGLKVSYGLVPRWGTIAYASSLDTVGPMANSIEDVATVLSVIAGRDSKDATTIKPESTDYYDNIAVPEPLTIGLPLEFTQDLNPEVKAVIEAAVKEFTKLGHSVKEVSIPYLRHGIPMYYLLALSETSSNLSRYDGIRYGGDRSTFTAETKRRIMLGTYALSAGYADKLYKNAQKARTVLIQQYNQALKECEVILSPVVPRSAPTRGSFVDDPTENLLADLFTVIANVVGVPSLALPAGFDKDDMPVGMQLMGSVMSEQKLINLGYQYQQQTNWHRQNPPLS